MLDKLNARSLQELLDRVAALEDVTFGGRQVGGRSAGDLRLYKRHLAIRRNTSTRTVDRDLGRGLLPPPDGIDNSHPWWWLSTIQRAERKQLSDLRRKRESAGEDHA